MAQAEAGVENWRAFGEIGIDLGTWRWELESGLEIAERRLAEIFGIDPASAKNGVPLSLFADAIDPRDSKEFGVANYARFPSSGACKPA